MSGLDLLRTLAREGVAVPVLMVTGEGDEHLAASVLRAGALDYMVKDHGVTFLVELPKRVVESVKRHRLEQMNRLLIQALESARDGVIITDLQGTILNVNQALERMTGYSRQELLGQTPRLFKSGAHPPEFYAALWRTILGRDSWQGELTNRRKDGTLFQASLTISPIVDPPGPDDPLRRHLPRHHRTQAAGAAAAAGAEDAERRHPGRRRGPRVQQPAGRHQRLRLAGPARAGRRPDGARVPASTSWTCRSGRRA